MKIEFSKHFGCCPARSSTTICQGGAMCQHTAGRNTSGRVSSQPEWTGHALSLVCQGDGIHYPVGPPLLGDSLHLLLASITDKELL